MSPFEMSESEAWAFLVRAREVTVAAIVGGRPLVRRMHAAFVPGEPHSLVLHGKPDGEKAAWAGAVAVAHDEVIARIPSVWRHPEKACPATTWYRSVHLEGRIEALEEPKLRAASLQALMEQLQPEGGYRPLTADDPLYAKTIRGLGMWRIVPERIVGKAKLGQHLNRRAMERVLEGLWRRGEAGDLQAIETCRAAHPEAVTFAPLPPPWIARCAPTEADVAAAVAMVRDAYWNTGFDDATLAEAVRRSAWVGIEAHGTLVASARALSDRRKRAVVYDVVVRPDHRGRGLGRALMTLLLDHPAVRDVAVLHLVTRDAMGLYERFGFVEVARRGAGEDTRVAMVCDRRG